VHDMAYAGRESSIVRVSEYYTRGLLSSRSFVWAGLPPV
jgi:hypothetical protein